MICLIPFPFVPMFWSMVIVCAPAIETVSPSPGTPASFHVVCPLALQLPVAFEVNAAAHAELAGVNHSSSSNDSRMICRFRFEAQKTEMFGNIETCRGLFTLSLSYLCPKCIRPHV